MNYQKLTVRSRLIWGVGLILALMIGLSIFSIQRVNYINKTLTQISEVNSVKQRYAINFRGSVHDRAISLRDVVLLPESAVAPVLAEIQTLAKFYADAKGPLDTIFAGGGNITPEERRLLANIHSIEASTMPLINRVIETRRAGQQQAAVELLISDAKPAFINWLASINAFIDYQEQQNQQATLKAHRIVGTFPNWLISLNLLALVIGCFVAWRLINYLGQALGGEPATAAELVRKIATGDLTSDIRTRYPDSMLGAVSQMQGRLRDIIHNIISASGELSVGANQLEKSSAQALQASQQQAASSTSSAASIEQMTVSINGIVDIVHQTEQNSEQTTALSEKGVALVRNVASEIAQVAETVQASSQQISSLQHRSREIAGIASVIQEIAGQTNLLALNAAIEAARAGTSGRGFAVVADEVRKLAERTSQATTEIAATIKQIQDETTQSVAVMDTTGPRVERGLALAKEAASMLEEIRNQAAESLHHVREVAMVTGQQSAAAGEIAGHVEQIAFMSRETSTSMQQNVQAVQSLDGIARLLKEQISAFRV